MRSKFNWLFVLCLMVFSLLLVSTFPDISFAKKKTPEDITHLLAYKIVKEFNDLRSQKGDIVDDILDLVTKSDASEFAKQEVMKKYNLTPKAFAHIQRMIEHDDFINRVIRDLFNQLKQKQLQDTGKETLTDAELDNISAEVKNQFPEAWDDYVEWRDDNQEDLEEKLKEQTKCDWNEVLVCELKMEIHRTIADFLIGNLEYFVKLVSIDEKDFYGENYKRYDLPEDSIYKYQKMVQEFAWTLLLLFFTYQTIRVLALYTVEPNGMLIKNLILKLIVTGILIQYEPYMVAILLEMNGMIMNGLLGMQSSQLAAGDFIEGMKITSSIAGGTVVATTLSLAAAMQSPILVAVFLVLAGMIFMFMIQVTIRFVEISILAVLGPMVIATNMNEQYNLFPAWWKSLLSTIFTVAVQFFLVVIMWAFITTGENSIKLHLDALGPLTRPLVCLAFFMVILKSPSFLKEWMYSSGAGSGAMGAASSIISKGGGHAKGRISQSVGKNMNRVRAVAGIFRK